MPVVQQAVQRQPCAALDLVPACSEGHAAPVWRDRDARVNGSVRRVRVRAGEGADSGALPDGARRNLEGTETVREDDRVCATVSWFCQTGYIPAGLVIVAGEGPLGVSAMNSALSAEPLAGKASTASPAIRAICALSRQCRTMTRRTVVRAVWAGPNPSFMPSKTIVSVPTMTGMAADEHQIPLDEQLAEIGAQLDWVRGYL